MAGHLPEISCKKLSVILQSLVAGRIGYPGRSGEMESFAASLLYLLRQRDHTVGGSLLASAPACSHDGANSRHSQILDFFHLVFSDK